MHDQPEPTEQEQEEAADGGRQAEEEAMRYPGHDDPALPGDDPPDEPIHES